jgi:MFS family permease
VMSIRLAIALGGTPLGSPIAGWLTDRFGPRVSIGMGVAAGVLATAVALAYFARNRDRREPEPDHAVVRGDLVDRGARRLP